MKNKEQVFMDIATDLSDLGTCDRKKVGAVVIINGRCITWGYNGAPPGLPHCEENNHGYGGPVLDVEECGCDMGVTCRQHQRLYQNLKEHGCRNATHAEANALAFAARQGISTDGGTLYVTCSPCDTCSRLLVAAGIVEVVYDEEYRDPAGRELLERAGVRCRSIHQS